MKTQHVCTNCGHTQVKWAGQCDGCGEWNTLEETTVQAAPKNRLAGSAGAAPVATPAKTTRLSSHTAAQYPRFESGSVEFDRVLGGGFVPGSMVVLSAEPGAGKALALDTPLPTPTGWTTMGDVKIGDQLFDENGKICEVVDATEVMHNRDVYEVCFANGEVIVADAQHEWFVETQSDQQSFIVVTQRLGELVAGDEQYIIRAIDTLVLPEKPLSFDPIDLAEQVIHNGIDEHIYHINELKRASTQQRLAFFEGMVTAKSSTAIAVSNEDIDELLTSCGQLASSQSFSGTRHHLITDVRPIQSVPVRCVQVSSESHLYLAGRSMIPTHNSTLSSRVIDSLAGQGKKVLYMAGEESGAQMRLRCDRMGLKNSELVDVTDTVELNQLGALLEGGYDFAVIDSMQTIYDANMSAAPGTPSILKQIGHVLMRIAKGHNVTLLIIGHVTKDGVLAGPRHVEHMVDVVLHMEGDRSQNLRVLRSMKNRFGATDEVGIFEMNEDGLVDISDAALLMMNEHAEAVPGSVICPTLEGSRPVFVEVQALAQPVAFQGAPPARRPRGIDKTRLDMLLAVLQRHSRMPLKLYGKDIYVNISNGLRIEESAIDLAVCVAVASAVTGRPVKENLAVWGEVSLLGEVRSVRGDSKRRNEATRLGLVPLAPEPRKKPIPLGQLLHSALDKASSREDLSEPQVEAEDGDREALPTPPPLRYAKQ